MAKDNHDNPNNTGLSDATNELDDNHEAPVHRQPPTEEEDIRNIKKIEIDRLIPFTLRAHRVYQGQRLTELMNSIARSKLLSPIIVRNFDNEKYEIVCGHNRANAVRALGDKEILADIRIGLSDEEAIKIFYDDNLNQQNFNDWPHSQKIEAIKYINELISKKSQQGKRTDLSKKEVEEATSVQNGQKLNGSIKRNNTRDKMARNFGIAPATLSKYRRILKLQDDVIAELAAMLDSKRLNLDLAYRISSLRDTEVKTLLEILKETLGLKPSAVILKQLSEASKASENDLTQKEMRAMLESTTSE